MARTIAELDAKTGGLSSPSKMPGHGWAISAWKCILGEMLSKKAGSVCSSCYARKGRYIFPNVQNAHAKRLLAWKKNPNWVRDMAELISRKSHVKFFRFFDSGDLQSVKMLDDIVQIAKLLPGIKFWLPSRERSIIKEYLSSGKTFPANLVVRISAAMVGQENATLPTGTVGSTVGANTGHACPARHKGNACGDCRACWNPKVKSVDYPLH